MLSEILCSELLGISESVSCTETLLGTPWPPLKHLGERTSSRKKRSTVMSIASRLEGMKLYNQAKNSDYIGPPPNSSMYPGKSQFISQEVPQDIASDSDTPPKPVVVRSGSAHLLVHLIGTIRSPGASYSSLQRETVRSNVLILFQV